MQKVDNKPIFWENVKSSLQHALYSEPHAISAARICEPGWVKKPLQMLTVHNRISGIKSQLRSQFQFPTNGPPAEHQVMLRYLSPSPPHGRPGLDSRLLISAWSSSCCYWPLGKELVNRRSLSPFFSLSLSPYLWWPMWTRNSTV